MRAIIAEFDEPSLAYLTQLTGGAPLEFIPNPIIYLSAPGFEDVEYEYSGYIDLQFHSAKVLFNPNFHQSEFDVFLDLTQPRTDLADFLKGPVEGMKPYFKWVDDPGRSSTSRSFCLSMTNSLRLDLRPLRAKIRSVLVDPSTESYKFNSSILKRDLPDHQQDVHFN